MEKVLAITFVVVYSSIFLGLIVLFIGNIIHRSKNKNDKGYNKCSVCGEAPSTVYYYDTLWGTAYHCDEHFWWDHKTAPKKN